MRKLFMLDNAQTLDELCIPPARALGTFVQCWMGFHGRGNGQYGRPLAPE